MINTCRNKSISIFKLFILSSLIILFYSCKSSGSVKVIKLAHGLDPSHPVHKAMEHMANRISVLSDGTMRMDIYPSEQLGSERECLELLQIGALGLTKVSASVLEGFVPAYKVLSLPYLFRSEEHRFNVLEGEIGKELLLGGEEYWLRGMCFFDAGSRSFYTKNRPILQPEDLVGLKIRTMESATAINMVNTLGGAATPISWGELYTSLQQGIVDGAENNQPSFYLSHHYEVCGYYSLDEHTAVPDVLLFSTIIWERLNYKEKDIIQVAVSEAAQVQKQLWKAASHDALVAVQEAGVEVHYPDKSLFEKKVQSIYDSYKQSQPELYSLIQEIKAVK